MKSNWNRRDVVKAVGSTSVLLAAGVGSAAAKGKPEDAPGRDGASGDENIVEKVSELNDADNGLSFDTLIAAVEEAGLVGALTNLDDQLTVFGPTDTAFGALGVTADNVDDVDFEAAVGSSLADILQYHVTEGRRYSQSIVNVPELEMLNGDTVAVGENEDGDPVLNPETDEAGLLATDVEASNGVIHAIDAVLLPPADD